MKAIVTGHTKVLGAALAGNLLARGVPVLGLARSRSADLTEAYPDLFEEVRGRGLLLGLKLRTEPRGFVAHLRDNHSVLTVSGADNTMRIVPPLVIDDAHIDEFMEKLSAGAASFLPEAVTS